MENTPGSLSTQLSGTGPEEKISKAATTAHGAIDKVAASADDSVAAVKPVIARVATAAHETVDKVTGLATPAVQWIEQQGGMLATKSRDAVADARTFVVAHPWQSLATAFAVGYLVGRRRGH